MFPGNVCLTSSSEEMLGVAAGRVLVRGKGEFRKTIILALTSEVPAGHRLLAVSSPAWPHLIPARLRKEMVFPFYR